MENIITDNEDFYCKSLKIGVTVDDIMAEINAYDWLELPNIDAEKLIKNLMGRMFFEPKNGYESIFIKSFAYKVERAIVNLVAIETEVRDSYNIPSSGGINNENIDRYYYLKYWADKKIMPINYNEKDYNIRSKYNVYTILMDILALKLENLNTYNNNKKK